MLSHNVKLSAKRMNLIEQLGHREGVELSQFGEFCASATKSTLPDIVNRVLSMCLEAGRMESSWLSSSKAKDFTVQVGEFLSKTYEQVEYSPVLSGVSGHQIEIAFGVQGKTKVSYVQPVGLRSGKLSWPNIYKVAGMMNDLREIEQQRFVIIDDSVASDDDGEFGAAVTALSEHSSVLPFSRRVDWHREIAA
jgi:hypothetical protein